MKYMGSKNKISKYIVPILQKAIDDNNVENYYEFFVGGANIIDKIKCKNRYGTDINKYLIELLKYARDNYDKENIFPNEISKEHYDFVRKSYNLNNDDFTDLEKGIVGFLASHNGRFFDGGYAKKIISKTGVERNYYDEAKRNLLKQAPNLKDINFGVRDYKDIDINKITNSVIYLDPPYKSVKGYDNINFNHIEIWQFAEKLSKNNNIVFISEMVCENDNFVKIWKKKIKRGSQSRKDIPCHKILATEKLYTYKQI